MRKRTFYLISLIFFCVTGQFGELIAQIVVDEAPRAHYYNRTARVKKFKDMKDFRDVFHSDKYLLGRNRISGNIGYNFQRVLVNDGVKYHNEYRSAMSFFTRYRFFEEFSINTTFYWDINRRAAARWIGDFAYSIGRYNWRPGKFNFGYENYINNQYNDKGKDFFQKMTEGYFFFSYNGFLSRSIRVKTKLDSTASIKITPFLRWAFRYRDETERVHFGGKPTTGLSARFSIFQNFYVEGAVYYYFTPLFPQLPWDPDYSYGFGYFDWRSFRVSITYGNWAINRFPWKQNPYPYYGFIDGNFRVVFNWIW
jgi:hypothetical protein